MSTTMITSRSVSFNLEKDSFFDSAKWDAIKPGPRKSFQVIRPRNSYQEVRPSFSARITQSRVVAPGRSPLRLSFQPPITPPQPLPVGELECPFSSVVLESDTSSSPAELYGDTPTHVRGRPVSCPLIPPIHFAKIGPPSTPSPPDNDSRPVQHIEHVYPSSYRSPVPVTTKTNIDASVPVVIQHPRCLSIQVPPSYKLPTPTSFPKSILKSPSNLRYSSAPVDNFPAFSPDSLPGKTPEPPNLSRSNSPVLNLRALPYFPRQTHDVRGGKLSPAATHAYQSYQRQPNPGLLPEPNRKKYPIRLPTRLPSQKPLYLEEDKSDPSWIFTAMTEDLPENKVQEEPIRDKEKKGEEIDLEFEREKQAKRRSLVPFIEYYDLLKENSEEIAVVLNVRTGRFRTEKKSALMERCYRADDYKARWNGKTNLQNECATALIDGMVVAVPLPGVGKGVSVSWLNILPNDFRYKEKEFALPGWLITGRSMGKVDEIFIEKGTR